jgi:hypothetical protein
VLEMPKWLDTLVCQLLEKKPELRPMDAKMVGGVLATIQEKVETKKSAGVDAVEKRRADRDGADTARPTDEDKEAARALRMGLGKVKPKKPKKKKPFFQRKWVHGVGIFLALMVIGSVLYLRLRPPSPEALYAEAEKQMKSSSTDDWEIARDDQIKKYLSRYGHQDNAMTRKMRAWADQVDVLVRERQLHRTIHLSKYDPSEEERLAFSAIEHQEKDEYTEARKDWEKLKEHSDKSEDARILALVAEKFLDQSQDKEDAIAELIGKTKPSELTWKDDLERMAAGAIQSTKEDDAGASVKWADVKKKAKDDQLWQFMASRNLEKLKAKEQSKVNSSGSK